MKRLIQGVRVYDHFGRSNRPRPLYPYDFLYCEIFTNVLRTAGLDCKHFDEFYICLADSVSKARKELDCSESWNRIAYLAFDYKKYMRASSATKDDMVFSVIKRGLVQIGKSEGLNLGVIRQACADVNETRLETVLRRAMRENRRWQAHIWWHPKPMEKELSVYLNVLDRKTGSDRDVLVYTLKPGTHEVDHLFKEIRIRKDEIWVLSSKTSWGRFFAKEMKHPKAITVSLADWRITKKR